MNRINALLPRSFSPRDLLPAIVLSLASAAAPTAWARQAPLPGQIPCDLVAKDSLAGQDVQSLAEYASKHLAEFVDPSADTSERARDFLLAPLDCAQVSVAFRIEYAKILEPALFPHIDPAKERQAINALRILGRLKSSLSTRGLDAGLASSSPAVRFAAASGYREMLRQVAKDDSGFTEASLERVLSSLASALQNEKDPVVADGIVLALGDATRERATLRGSAMLKLAETIEQRARALRTEPSADHALWSNALLRAVDATRLTIFDQAATGVNKDLARKATLLSGQVFAYVRDRASSEAKVPGLVALGAAAEGMAVIAHNAVSGESVAERGLKSALENRDQRAIATAIDPWIGAQGHLLKAPYNARAQDYAAVP